MKRCCYCGRRFYPSHSDRYDVPNCSAPACRRRRKTERQREIRAARLRAGFRAAGRKLPEDPLASPPSVRLADRQASRPELRRHQIEHLGQ